MSKQKTSLILGICLLASFVSLLFFSRSSFLYPMNTWVDSNASLTMGRAFMQGRVLYRDIFDQRGPYLYLFYGLASLVSGGTFTGVFLLEWLTFSAFLYFSYRLVCLYVSKYAWVSVLILAIIVPSSKAFGLGGSPEELLLPIFAYSLFSLLQWIKSPEQSHPTALSLFLNGLLCGVVFWTKYNMIGFFAGYVAALIIVLILRKSAKYLLACFGLLLTGFIVSTIPWIVYFGVHHAISDWLNGYFVSNLTNYMVVTTSVPERILAMIVNIRNTLVRNLQYSLLSLGGLIWVLFSKKQTLSLEEKIAAWLTAAVMLFVIYVGGKDFYYYGLPVSVFSVFGIVLLLRLGETLGQRSAVMHTLVKIGLCGVTALLLLFGLTTSRNTPFLQAGREEYIFFHFRDIIKKSDSQTLMNYGSLDLGLYNVCEITPSTKYFCPLNLRSSEMTEEIDGYLSRGSVEFIVSLYDDLAQKFDRYELIDSGYSVLNEGRTDVFLYRLKTPSSVG